MLTNNVTVYQFEVGLDWMRSLQMRSDFVLMLTV